MNELFYNICNKEKMTATQALKQVEQHGGFFSECSHIHRGQNYHTKVTFTDGSLMFFGDNTYTTSIE